MFIKVVQLGGMFIKVVQLIGTSAQTAFADPL